jgi:demethylmenaquinone methyltransferase/2-methoxy-6-polyprenyl-1,4-benzoquinol methylase
VKKGVQKIYQEVAPTYELINHVLTWGFDIRWRKRAVRAASSLRGGLWMDVCSGTGELAQALARSRDDVRMLALDFSLPMLEKAREKKGLETIFFSLGDVTRLPFADNTFDLLSISFATRNLNPNPDYILSCLQEFCRVLKPGGVFLNLETSQPRSRILQKLFHIYIGLVVKPVGYFISGSRAGYKYLAHTIPRFYGADDFSALLRKSGFQKVQATSLFWGIAAIHLAEKSG